MASLTASSVALLGLVLGALSGTHCGVRSLASDGGIQADGRFTDARPDADAAETSDLGPSLDACSAFCGLANQMNQVSGDCVFALPRCLNASEGIFVYADGTTVPWDRSHLNGWDYEDASMTRVRFYGPLCSEVRDGAVPHIDVVMKCPAP